MAKAIGISEAKIRQAIWMLKAKKTKKQVCEHLGIAYNTKRLDNIIQEFHNNIEREAELKKKARLKKFTLSEKQGIADSYLNGETQSSLAKQFYISPQRIKNILIEMNVPIRARGKGKAANVEHVVQDLEVRFKKGDKVFLAKENTFATVKEVYDEDWLEDNSKYENIGNIVVNLCFRNYKISKFVNAYFNIQCNDELKEEFNTNLYINLQKSDVNDYL